MSAHIAGEGGVTAARTVDSDTTPSEPKIGNNMKLDEVLARCKVDSPSKVVRLNMWGVGLTDISVVRSLPNLEIVSLSMNKISSLRPLQHCKKVTELYLRKNDIPMSQAAFVSTLPSLQILWLSDNPCASHPRYRTMCIKWCPNLTMFDQTPVTPAERAEAEALARTDDQCLALEEEARAILAGDAAYLTHALAVKAAPGHSRGARERKSIDESDMVAEPAEPDATRKHAKLQDAYVASVLTVLPLLDKAALRRLVREAQKRLDES